MDSFRRRKRESDEWTKTEENNHLDRGQFSEIWEDIFNFVSRESPPSNHNVLLVGLPGAGKSSLVNTIIKVIAKRRIAKAEVGAGVAKSKTTSLTWFHCMGVTTDDIEYHPDHKLRIFVSRKSFPNLVDFAGLMNQSDERLVELLQLIINGQVPPDTKIQDLLDKQEEHGTGVLRKELPSSDECKMGTVIFVHSVRDRVPKGLISCLQTALERKDGGHGVRTFVVLTKCDLVEDEWAREEMEETKKVIASEFSIKGAESEYLFEWKNYCDDIGYDDPSIEENVLKLLKMVLVARSAQTNSSAKKVSTGFKDLPARTRGKLAVKKGIKKLNIRLTDIVLYVSMVIFMLLLVCSLLKGV